MCYSLSWSYIPDSILCNTLLCKEETCAFDYPMYELLVHFLAVQASQLKVIKKCIHILFEATIVLFRLLVA